MKQMVTSLFGMFGSAVALLFGGWDIALQTLVLFMGIDWRVVRAGKGCAEKE